MAIHGRQRANVHPEAPGDGGAHRLHLQVLPLDFTGFDHIVGERGEAGLIAERQAEIRQPPQQHALGTADLGDGLCEHLEVVAPVGPAGGLPDIGVIAAFHAEIMVANLRMRNLISA
ncbi:hypothetical protein D3C87_1239980 [compost metagenome]